MTLYIQTRPSGLYGLAFCWAETTKQSTDILLAGGGEEVWHKATTHSHWSLLTNFALQPMQESGILTELLTQAAAELLSIKLSLCQTD